MQNPGVGRAALSGETLSDGSSGWWPSSLDSGLTLEVPLLVCPPGTADRALGPHQAARASLCHGGCKAAGLWGMAQGSAKGSSTPGKIWIVFMD